VLKDTGMTNCLPGELLAWTDAVDSVVVTAHRGTNHVAIVVHRERDDASAPWRIFSAHYRMVENGEPVCLWIRGEEQFNHAPTRAEIDALIRRVYVLQVFQPAPKFICKGTFK
jgi:hypothetical protein